MRRDRTPTAVAAGLWILVAGTGLQSHADTPGSAPERKNTEVGYAIQELCITCHGNPAFERAPSPAALRSMSPERIYAALTSGVMKPVGEKLSDEDRRRVSESLSGQLLGSAQSGDAGAMPNRCPRNPPLSGLSGPGWNGWGNGPGNERFQAAVAAGLDPDSVARLTLKWAFGYPGGTSAYGQPTVVMGRVFVGTDTGYIYSLDAATGCLYWSYRSRAGVRTAMTVGSITVRGRARYAVFFGDLKANAYAIDAQTGAKIWTARADGHYTARITAAPALYRGRLYVPVSSWEGFQARVLDYPCCTAVGSVTAFDANTGRRVWKTYSIARRPRPIRRNSKGVQQWAPAGAPIWNTPTIDPVRHAVYVGTGDGTTYPAAPTSDAVLALDMGTGKVLWSRQVYPDDAFIVGCSGAGFTDNCPKVAGPDWDIPMSPMLRKLDSGRTLLIFGTKPGDVLALDPDRQGETVWRANALGDVPPPADAGAAPTNTNKSRGPVWGGALDGRYAYFGLNAGGVAALRIADGQRGWYAPLNSTSAKTMTHAAAATAIPGVVFIGGSDGRLWAVSSEDGHSLWSFDTARPFDTVNGVHAHGGSIAAPGPTVAAGMLFVGSGYGVIGGTPGNVLLAFAVQ